MKLFTGGLGIIRFRKRIALMIVVVPVLVFVSFSFGEVSMDSPVQSKCIGIIGRDGAERLFGMVILHMSFLKLAAPV